MHPPRGQSGSLEWRREIPRSVSILREHCVFLTLKRFPFWNSYRITCFHANEWRSNSARSLCLSGDSSRRFLESEKSLSACASCYVFRLLVARKFTVNSTVSRTRKVQTWDIKDTSKFSNDKFNEADETFSFFSDPSRYCWITFST